MEGKVGGLKSKIVSPSKEPQPLTGLQKRARRKAVSKPLSGALMGVTKSDLMRRAYKRTHEDCGERVTQIGGKLSTMYCKARWCVTCNNIRSARAWAGYGEEVLSWKTPQFVTLTVPNVSGALLRPTLQKMHHFFQNCWRSLKYRGLDVKLIRATEVTWNEKTGEFHPHMHVLCADRQVAVLLVKAWLKRWEGTSNAAQDIRAADVGSVRELFKYAGKLVSEARDKDGMRKVVPPAMLDEMFSSMRKLRLWAAVGIESALKEDEVVDEEEMKLDESTAATKRFGETITWEWFQAVADWVDLETGEVLSEYEMSDKMKVWVKKLENLT